MSAILGIYSKKGKICSGEIDSVIRDFSLDHQRKLQTVSRDRIIFSSMKSLLGKGIVWSEDNASVILFKGEIYNFERDVEYLIKKGHRFIDKKSCAEFLLHAFQEFGSAFLKDIDGTFSFAIYNVLNDTLVVGNDSFGIEPLFIYNDTHYFIFSSEYEPLVRYKTFNNELDYNAIAEYFILSVPYGNKTFFKNIHNLAPGSVGIIKENAVRFEQYDDLNIKIEKNKDLKECAYEISQILRESVQKRLARSSDFVFALTGGVDTRLLLASLNNDQRRRATFLTWRNNLLKPSEDTDVIIAKMLAEKLQLKHRVVNVNLNKTERYFGEKFFKGLRKIKPESKRFFAGRQGSQFIGGRATIALKNFFRFGDMNEKNIEADLKRIFSKKFIAKVDNPYFAFEQEFKKIKCENKKFFWGIRHFTRGFFMAFGGALSGWVSPCRWGGENAPYIDKLLLKKLLSFPPEYVENRRLQNEIFKTCYPEFTQIPTNSSLADIEGSCIKRFDRVAPNRVLHPRLNRLYLNAMIAYLYSHYTWDKGFYKHTHFPNLRYYLAFVNFEGWYRAFVRQKRARSSQKR